MQRDDGRAAFPHEIELALGSLAPIAEFFEQNCKVSDALLVAGFSSQFVERDPDLRIASDL